MTLLLDRSPQQDLLELKRVLIVDDEEPIRRLLGYMLQTWVGVNRGKTYFFFTLDPGEHYFCSEAENQDYLALTVEAGKTYYLKQRVEPGVWKARTDLAIIDEEKAKKELPDINLSVFELKK